MLSQSDHDPRRGVGEVITNYHSFLLRDAKEIRGVSKTTRQILTGGKKTDAFTETSVAMVTRVLRGFGSLTGKRTNQVMIFSDEAHHCYQTASRCSPTPGTRNTVTRILGIRAFRSQLPCERAFGRGLRHRSYAVNDAGLFEPPALSASHVASEPGREQLRISTVTGYAGGGQQIMVPQLVELRQVAGHRQQGRAEWPERSEPTCLRLRRVRAADRRDGSKAPGGPHASPQLGARAGEGGPDEALHVRWLRQVCARPARSDRSGQFGSRRQRPSCYACCVTRTSRGDSNIAASAKSPLIAVHRAPAPASLVGDSY